MTATPVPSRRPPAELVLLPLATVALHLASLARPWGFFRDELYYLACADHLAWGYVDHPPLSIAVLAAWRAVFGDSLFAVRLPAVLAGAATVLFAGLLARRLGAGTGGRVLAMVAVLACPTLRALAGFYSMNALEILLWTVLAWLVAGLLLDHRSLDGGAAGAEETAGDRRPSPHGPSSKDRRRWLLVGVVAGLGLLNKLSMSWLLGGLALGVLITRHRRRLASPWPWLSAALATLSFLPHLLWQMAHGWPTVEFMRNATEQKMVSVSPLDFLAGQVMGVGPPLALLAVAGVVFLFTSRDGALRPLAVAVVAIVVLLAASGSSRAGYLAPAYPLVLAAGSVAVAGWLRRPAWGRPALAAVVVLVLAFGGVAAPLCLPLLPVESYVAYARALGVEPGTEERKEVGLLPQHFADRFGWPELAAEVERVHRALPPTDREVASVFTSNYGQAGAIDHFASGLPPTLSGHNSYWLWGPRGQTAEVLIAVVADGEALRAFYGDVELASRTSCRWCMPYEDGVPIWVARRPRRTLTEAWPAAKHYD